MEGSRENGVKCGKEQGAETPPNRASFIMFALLGVASHIEKLINIVKLILTDLNIECCRHWKNAEQNK